MKKTITKAVSKPAPASKKAPSTKPALKAAAPVLKKKTAARPPGAKAAKPVVTVITARIDIGFGNALYLRGEGPGLSWDRGVPLDCADDDCWTITLPETAQPILFKFLVNDLTWSTGPDHVALSGSKVEIVPVF